MVENYPKIIKNYFIFSMDSFKNKNNKIFKNLGLTSFGWGRRI